MPEATSKPTTVSLDVQDPLPESSWTWRRALIFGGGTVQAVAVGFIIFLIFKIALMLGSVGSVAGVMKMAEWLYKLGWWLILLTLVDRILYLIAPSAEQATKMLATAKMVLGGASFSTTQTASSDATTSTTATTTDVSAPGDNNERSATSSDPAGPVEQVADPGDQLAGTSVEVASATHASADSIPEHPPSER